MIVRPYCKGCMYTLRAAYTSWTPQMMLPRTPATLRIRARLCAKIASRAAQVAVGLTLTKGDQQGWRYAHHHIARACSRMVRVLGRTMWVVASGWKVM